MADIVKQSQLGVPIGNKTVLGQLTSFSDGTAKWTYAKDINPLIAGFGDRSTFTLGKKSDGTWSWSPTTNTSLTNLATRENLTAEQINNSLYVDKAPASTVLNSGNVNNLGGIAAAKKLGVPGTNGVATVTGTLPGQVSGNFPGQENATPDPENPDASNQEGVEASNENIQKGVTETNAISIASDARPVSEYPDDLYLRYPIDLDTKQDCVTFTMLEYRPRKLSPTGILEGNAFEGRSTATDKQRGKTVTLPIQPGISDSNTVQWGPEEMNAINAIMAATAMGSITDGAVGAEASINSITKLIGDNKAEVKAAVAAYFSEQASKTKGLLTRTTGAIINPNMELLFQGPNLRSFNFTFSLSAREPDEAKRIRNIIRFFKQGMSVKRATTGLFLKTPHTFEIKYLQGGNEHPWINKIKECALTSFNVNYTPAGNYATFYDGSMTQYDLSMQFSELEPVYDDDYKTKSTTFESEIGY
jgi:hypothetical protein